MLRGVRKGDPNTKWFGKKTRTHCKGGGGPPQNFYTPLGVITTTVSMTAATTVETVSP